MSPRAALSIVFLAALIVRLLIAAGASHIPIVSYPSLDSRQYFLWANWILEGRLIWPQPWPQGPGYPLLLAAMLAAGGGSLFAVAVIQSVLGAISATLTAAIARSWFGASAGLAAGLLQAVYAPLAFAETSILVEGPLVLLISLFVWWWIRPGTRDSARPLMVAGVTIGAAAVVRSTALPVAVGFGALLLLPVRSSRLVPFALGLLLVTFPVAAINASQGGGWKLQGKGGLNFWIGNTPDGDGLASFRLGRGWDRAEGDADRAGVLDVAAHDRYYFAKTMREIADAPGAWLALMARKAFWSLQREEIRDSLSYHYFASEIIWLRVLPGFGILLPFAIAGLVAAARQRTLPRELILWLALTWLALSLFVVGYRYRLPLVPPLAILAGAGIAALRREAHAAHERRWQPLAALVVIILAAHALTGAATHAPSRNFAEELTHTGDALLVQRRYTEAEEYYRRALSLDGHYAAAWKGLGMRFYSVGRLDDARAALQRAVAIEPMYADAWVRLAWTAGRQQRYREASGHMRRASDIYPRDIEIRRYLGRYLFEAGAFREAAEQLARVVAANPRDDEAAGLLEMARRRAE